MKLTWWLRIIHQKHLPLLLTREGTFGHQFLLRLVMKIWMYKHFKVNGCSKFRSFLLALYILFKLCLQ